VPVAAGAEHEARTTVAAVVDESRGTLHNFGAEQVGEDWHHDQEIRDE